MADDTRLLVTWLRMARSAHHSPHVVPQTGQPRVCAFDSSDMFTACDPELCTSDWW